MKSIRAAAKGSGTASGFDWGALIGGLFDGFNATGGFIKPGHVGVVGERGPELAFGGKSWHRRLRRCEPEDSTIINFSIAAPDGNVSRQTQSQIAARVGAVLGTARNRGFA